MVFCCLAFLFAVASAMEIKGMSFTGDRYCPHVPFDSASSFASLHHLATTGCNYVALVVTWYQESYMSSRIFPVSRPLASHDVKGSFWDYTFVSESPRAVVAAIREAHALGMKVRKKAFVGKE